MTNKTIGNRFERDICELLASKGFWVHNFQQNSSGQPADVIALNRKASHLIDCKVCASARFPVVRIEDNQQLSMDSWCNRVSKTAWFCLRMTKGTYMISWNTISREIESRNPSSLGETWIATNGMPIEVWIERFA